jgi:hypothetical protein
LSARAVEDGPHCQLPHLEGLGADPVAVPLRYSDDI